MSLPTREEFLGQLEEVQSDEECPVCYEVVTVPVKTTCNHIFCRRCAKKCFASSNKCPYCRTKVSEDLDTDPAFMHVHFLGSDTDEDDFETFDLRDMEGPVQYGDQLIRPPYWIVCRRPARAGDPTTGRQLVITADVVHSHVEDEADTSITATATEHLAQLEIEDTQALEQDGQGDESVEEVQHEDNHVEAQGGDHDTKYHYFTCERHNFHLDEDVDEDIARTAMSYLWGCRNIDHSPNLDGQVLIEHEGLFPRAIGALLMIIPDRYTSNDVEMPKWTEICLADWKRMAQYLEYKLQELQDEGPQWQAREFKAELYKGWQAEMMEDDIEDEESVDEQSDDVDSGEQSAEGEDLAQEEGTKEENNEKTDDQRKSDTEESLFAKSGEIVDHEETHSGEKDSNKGNDIETSGGDNVHGQEDSGHDDSSSTSRSERAPRVPTYSARVVETHSRGCTFEQNVNHLFDFITYFAQGHYNSLPYENWGPDREGVQEIDLSYEVARVYRNSP